MPSGVAEAEAAADSRNFEGGLSFSKCAMRGRKSFEEDEPGQDGAENEDAAARRAERAFGPPSGSSGDWRQTTFPNLLQFS